jgi:hypothetical protein
MFRPHYAVENTVYLYTKLLAVFLIINHPYAFSNLINMSPFEPHRSEKQINNIYLFKAGHSKLRGSLFR